MKLSIIVPIYKVEKYLRRCIDSILVQTFVDYELILVDDGSPDGCPAICDEYASRDHRIRVVHKENGGLSSARNAGLDIAQGEYIGFVDSDDYIRPDMYEILIHKAAETGAEITAIGYTEVDENGDILRECMTAEEDRIYCRSEFLNQFFPDTRWEIAPTAWNKLYRRELFASYRYPVDKIYEDSYAMLPLFDMCQKIAVSRKRGYYYVCSRSDSIMNASYSVKNLDLLDLGQSQYAFFRDKAMEEQSQYALEEYTNKYIMTALAVAFLNPALKPEFYQRRSDYVRLIPRVLANPKTCRMKKLIVLLTLVDMHHAHILTRKYFPELLIRQMR